MGGKDRADHFGNVGMIALILVGFMEIQSWTGVSLYAGMAPKFPVEQALRTLPGRLKRPAIAVLWGSFGGDTELIKGFIEKFKNKEHLIQIHITNECARRSGRCLEGRCILPKLDHTSYTNMLSNKGAKKFIRDRLDEIDDKISPLLTPNTHIWLSSGLEIAVTSKRGLSNLHEFIRRWINQRHPESRLLKAKIVYNPMKYELETYGADFRESHGADFNGDIYNLDGLSLDFTEQFFQSISKDTFLTAMRAVSRKPRAVFLWNADHQGLRGTTSWIHKYPYANREYIFEHEVTKGFQETLLELQEVLNDK